MSQELALTLIAYKIEGLEVHAEILEMLKGDTLHLNKVSKTLSVSASRERT